MWDCSVQIVEIVAHQLRDWSEVQVSTRSPNPERPISVSDRAPSRTAKRTISAKPRVISAARALSPRPAPITIPAAIAITFFRAPPSSAPVTSVVRYKRKSGVES